MSRKILAKGEYTGEFNGRPFTKVLLVYSENGQYPKMISVDKDVYETAEAKHGNLLNKDVEMSYQEHYGKFKVSEIKCETKNQKPIMDR